MTDIAPDLLKRIREYFGEEISEISEQIKKGDISYDQAYGYSIKIGDALSRAFDKDINVGILPDGRMYYNIADKVVRPMLQEEHNLVSEIAVKAQQRANKAAGIGIKALPAEFDAEKAQGIIDRVSSQPFEEVKWILNEPVKTFAKNVVDRTLEKNVEFQGKSGLRPKIVRRVSADACPWCQAVAGTYSYPNVPKDVYRRHKNCDCVVEYIEGGKIQDVWTKEEFSSRQERIESAQRKAEEAKARYASDKTKEILSKQPQVSDDDYKEFVKKLHAEGIAVERGGEWDDYLEKTGKEAITFEDDNGGSIIYHSKLSYSGMYEEREHIRQIREGKAFAPGTIENMMCEIEAKDALIKNAKEYKISDMEVSLLKKQIREYKRRINEMRDE